MAGSKLKEGSMGDYHNVVLYHDDADGFGAAYACWKHLKDGNTLYIPVQYEQPVPDIPAGVHNVFIVDFSYDRATCDELAQRYHHLVVIDHHKTAEVALLGAPYAKFDQSKSGAMLAWEYFSPPCSAAPDIIKYVQDYDLWKFELPESRAVNLFISTLRNEFEAWDNFSLKTALLVGGAIEAFQDAQLERRMKDVEIIKFSVPQRVDYDLPDVTFSVPCLNATENISELGNAMCKAYPDAPFSVSYCDRKDGTRTYSLRSVGEFDVSDIAKAFGGGGHKNAAGFSKRIA